MTEKFEFHHEPIYTYNPDETDFYDFDRLVYGKSYYLVRDSYDYPPYEPIRIEIYDSVGSEFMCFFRFEYNGEIHKGSSWDDSFDVPALIYDAILNAGIRFSYDVNTDGTIEEVLVTLLNELEPESQVIVVNLAGELRPSFVAE